MLWTQAYLLRLRRDLDRWVEQGFVTPDNADKILSSLETRHDGRKLPGLLTLLGAALLIFAALTFVAANWAEIPRWLKLVMIFGSMWAAYAGAIWLERRAHPLFAQAAVLTGLGLFGASIMLIAQIYHIETDDPVGLLAWCVAALATAWALPSRPALALGLGLAVIWSSFASDNWGTHIHWWFFLPWAAGAVLAFRLRWRPGFHLAVITFLAWLLMNATGLSRLLGGEQEFAAIIALLATALWLGALAFRNRWMQYSLLSEHYGMFIALAAFAILQADEVSGVPPVAWFIAAVIAGGGAAALGIRAMDHKQIEIKHLATPAALALAALLYPLLGQHQALLIYATILLGVSVGLVAYGLARQSRFAVNLGFWAFGLEVLYLYFETLGTLLGTAAFFALGGVILIAGGTFMERLRRRLVETTGKGA